MSFFFSSLAPFYHQLPTAIFIVMSNATFNLSDVSDTSKLDMFDIDLSKQIPPPGIDLLRRTPISKRALSEEPEELPNLKSQKLEFMESSSSEYVPAAQKNKHFKFEHCDVIFQPQYFFSSPPKQTRGGRMKVSLDLYLVNIIDSIQLL